MNPAGLVPSRYRPTIRRSLNRVGIRRTPRQSLAAQRMRVERGVMARRGRPAPSRHRILCYHGVGTPSWGVNDVSPARFRRQLETAVTLGYRFAPAAEVADALAPSSAPRDTGPTPSPVEQPMLAVTFDDGLRSVAEQAAPILKSLEIPWTVFVVSDWAEGRHRIQPSPFLDWDGIVLLAGAGASIGSHSRSHHDFARLSDAEAADELSESSALINLRTGLEVVDFAIPFGQSGNWSNAAGRLAGEAGYQRIYAQSERRRPEATIARTFVSHYDDDRVFTAALGGVFDDWEEWV